MDSSEKDNFVMEKESGGDHLNYHESSISSEWRFAGGLHLANPQIGLVATDNPVGNPPIGSPSCSSVSVADAFCPSLWNHHHGSENLGFGESNIQTTVSAPNAASARKSVFGSSSSGMAKTADLGWNPLASKGEVFMQPGSGVLPQSLSQFPSDSDFIERAARLSCFNNGNFSDMVNPFSMPVSLSSYAKGGVQAPEFQSENRMKGVIPGMHSLKINLRGKEAVKDVSAPVDHGAIEGLRREIGSGDVLKPSEEVKHGVQGLSHESNEAELSGNGQDDPSGLKNTVGEPSAKGASAKKRKRGDQDLESDQAKGASELLAAAQLSSETSKDNLENKQKAEYTSTPGAKHTGKNGKDSSQNSDPPKDDYIHVRARRGQATNSHSLAERVRREKISERMKFLQDLVPGCSKVTGKAVMLDEIINYVQSLQRQVEFLSMKLATVNPRLDVNIEGLAKDVFQPRTGASSSIGFPTDISTFHPQMHPSQQGLIHASIPGMENPTDSLRRTISSQLAAINGYKDLSSQITNVWDDDLHNVVQMSFGMNATFNSQESNVAETMKSVHKPLIYREKGDKRVWTISRPTAVVGGRLLLTADESDTTQASSCTANEA